MKVQSTVRNEFGMHEMSWLAKIHVQNSLTGAGSLGTDMFSKSGSKPKTVMRLLLYMLDLNNSLTHDALARQ